MRRRPAGGRDARTVCRFPRARRSLQRVPEGENLLSMLSRPRPAPVAPDHSETSASPSSSSAPGGRSGPTRDGPPGRTPNRLRDPGGYLWHRGAAGAPRGRSEWQGYPSSLDSRPVRRRIRSKHRWLSLCEWTSKRGASSASIVPRSWLIHGAIICPLVPGEIAALIVVGDHQSIRAS
jgi:hypothetical protein